MKNFGNINLLRFLGAIIVMVYHIPINNKLYEGLPLFFRDGYAWVFFFFICSGFLLIEKYSQSTLNYKSFLINKIKRLYPLYLISFVIVLVSINKLLNPVQIITALTLTHPWLIDYMSYSDPSWYLSTLFFLYALCPLFLHFYKKKKTIFIIVAIITVLYLNYFVSLFLSVNEQVSNSYNLYFLVKYFPPIFIPVFIFGFFINNLYKRLQYNLIFKKSFIYIIILVIIIFAYQTSSYLFNTIFFSLVVLFSVLDEGLFNKLTSISFVSYLAKLSFPIYILHRPIHYFLLRISLPLESNYDKLIYYIIVILFSICITSLLDKITQLYNLKRNLNQVNF